MFASTMTDKTTKKGLLVDWRAVFYAGLLAGTFLLLLNLFLLPTSVDGGVELTLRYMASIVLGEGVLTSEVEFSATIIIIAMLLHYVLALFFTCLVAFVVHRGGLLLGAIGGLLLGIALYFINLYSLTWFFPWFFVMEGTIFFISHAIFGTIAGTMYEILEREEYEEAQGERTN